jgi:hypothetical protein
VLERKSENKLKDQIDGIEMFVDLDTKENSASGCPNLTFAPQERDRAAPVVKWCNLER